MTPFRRFERSTGLFIGLLMVSFLLATFDVRAEGTGVGGQLREGAQSIFAPVQEIATAVTRPVVGFIDGISNIAGLRDEVERLQAENADLQAQITDVQSLQNRVEELEQINNLQPPGQLATVTARISSVGASDFDQIRWIDKGTADGVALGQAVIDEDGLVGRIDFAAEGSARVRLITDPRSGIGVRNLTTNETGWVEGRGQDNSGSHVLQLKMFNAERPVAEGDRLVTDGTRFPPGIDVGLVTEAATAQAGFTLVTSAEPSIALSGIDYVKVIVGWSPLDSVIAGDQEVPVPGIDFDPQGQ